MIEEEEGWNFGDEAKIEEEDSESDSEDEERKKNEFFDELRKNRKDFD